MWTCAVCETVNPGGRTCNACGAQLTRRAAVTTTVRGGLPTPLPPVLPPLPEPVQRAINREPIPPEEWEAYEAENRLDVRPIPGGCLLVFGPRPRPR